MTLYGHRRDVPPADHPPAADPPPDGLLSSDQATSPPPFVPPPFVPPPSYDAPSDHWLTSPVPVVPPGGAAATDDPPPDEDSPEQPPARTPPKLLATDPRSVAPAWMSLAGPEDPAAQDRALSSPRESTRPILDLTAPQPPEPVRALRGRPMELDLSDFDPDPVDDGGDIVPWDRRPLMAVLAGAAALVVLGVASGMASASLFGRPTAPVDWRSGGGAGPSITAPAAPPAQPETITLAGVGDVIMGTEPGDIPPRNGSGFFDPVKEALAADLVMGNLETPLTADTGRVKCAMVTPSPEPGNPSPEPTREAGCHQFYLPPSYAEHLRDGGFQLLSLANNHTHDMGAEGLKNTRAALDAVGIEHTGAPGQITYIEVKGVKVAVIGFGIYSWTQNLNNIPAAKDLVGKAAAAADLVVIQMQGGAEGSDRAHIKPGNEFFYDENRGDLMKFARAVIDAGADVVFGHGPHIMRGMEFYKGRLVAYSLGNFCGYGVLNSSGFLGVGGVLKVTLTKDGEWVDGQLIATEMVKGGVVALDAQKRALSFVNGLSRDDFGASAAKIATRDGKITQAAAT